MAWSVGPSNSDDGASQRVIDGPALPSVADLSRIAPVPVGDSSVGGVTRHCEFDGRHGKNASPWRTSRRRLPSFQTGSHKSQAEQHAKRSNEAI